jgi:type II pantothenate kinase
VLIGNLTLLPQCREVFPGLEKLYKVHFIIPKYAEFCTAIGAALDYINRK